MEPELITIRGAREHNLQGITVEIPKKRLVVLSGPSGSGKSSLAFDTLYAEGQRRYVESLSSYARQFLGQMQKPHYDSIRGLSPTIAIEQKAASNNPRSTVGTITEITDYLRVLFARAGTQHCPGCGEVVQRSSAQAIVRELERLVDGTRYLLLAPVLENRKGGFREVLEALRRDGLVRARIDGEVVELADVRQLDKRRKHRVDAVVDRLVAGRIDEGRLADSVETALSLGEGRLIVQTLPTGRAGAPGPDRILSENLACEACHLAFSDLTPQRLSFNSPLGMCPECNGLGSRLEMDPERFVGDDSLSILEGAVQAWGKIGPNGDTWDSAVAAALAEAYGFDLSQPFSTLKKKQRDAIFFGTGSQRIAIRWRRKGRTRVRRRRYEGLVHAFKRRLLQTTSEQMKTYYSQFLSRRPCPGCDGARLQAQGRHVRFCGLGFCEAHQLPIARLRHFLETLRLNRTEAKIATELLKEICGRVRFLCDVGLGYLTLARLGPSLSGGEAQRIRLASQIGSELTGVVYVLDEPSIGLHQRDNQKLLQTLLHLRDLGNTVVVVEHDRETLESADHLIDFGPGAGVHGGRIVAAGTPAEVRETAGSLTGDYLAGRREIETPRERRVPGERWIGIRGASIHNLKDLDIDLPVGLFTCITGVSGAGKSSLVHQTMLPALKRKLHRDPRAARPGPYRSIRGLEAIDKVISIDQQPIGRTPRSNPATYVKLFDQIRALYAALPHSRMYGYKPGRFSFNVKGGRCEACRGAGLRRVEMHFLADVYVTCEECGSKRFNDATLRVKFKGRSIADALRLTVAEAAELFQDHPAIHRILQTLVDVGLDYLELGQPSTTLSGGEAQRIKLSRELAKRATGRTLYVLDEPSTGLHFEDIRRLIGVLQRLVDQGNTVVVIEHNLDIIKVADWVVDLGPEGGDAGGELVCQGTPEAVARCEASYTGQHLQALWSADRLGERTGARARRAARHARAKRSGRGQPG